MLDQGVTDVRPVEICDGAWLGQNVVICPGVRVGRGAVVGANSAVRDDVPDYAVAVGAPARVVREFGRVAQLSRETRPLPRVPLPADRRRRVQRSAKFVRDLPTHDYDPIVITGPGFEESRWTPVDRSLEQDVAPGTTARRLPTQPPPSAGGWRGRANRWLGLQDPFFRWWRRASRRRRRGTGGSRTRR